MSSAGPDSRGDETPCALAPIQQVVYAQVMNARRRWTFSNLERQVAHQEGCSRREARAAIRDLIEQGFVEYSYTFGQSYLVLSFRHPVNISPLFTIIPPGYTGDLPTHRHGIAIAPGVSFGSGRHPTTRLALQALEKGGAYLRSHPQFSFQSAIDIGTGSGVLAIAASCLGAQTVMALDIDACARSEARQNIDANPGVAAAISVSDTPLTGIENRFDMIIANLRLPTLIQFSTWIPSHLEHMGCVVVSGFREEEWDRLLDCYASHRFHALWQDSVAGWSAGLLVR